MCSKGRLVTLRKISLSLWMNLRYSKVLIFAQSLPFVHILTQYLSSHQSLYMILHFPLIIILFCIAPKSVLEICVVKTLAKSSFWSLNYHLRLNFILKLLKWSFHVTPNFKDKIECTKLMCAQGSVTHIS